MAKFILTQFRRFNRNLTVGTRIYDWAIDADTLTDAIRIARSELLTDYQPPADFAVLRDDSGKMVWDEVWDA
jgi:hypothetical protein